MTAHMIRTCKVHGETNHYWHLDNRHKAGGYWLCMACQNDGRYRNGTRIPLGENKACSSYLGIVVAEELLGRVFNNVAQMPYGNPGYDFICARNYKIDSKIGTLSAKHNRWQFDINANTTADYFACIAIVDRDDIEPEHFWIIPGSKVNYLKGNLTIYNTERSLAKWDQYARPLNKISACCAAMKE